MTSEICFRKYPNIIVETHKIELKLDKTFTNVTINEEDLKLAMQFTYFKNYNDYLLYMRCVYTEMSSCS